MRECHALYNALRFFLVVIFRKKEDASLPIGKNKHQISETTCLTAKVEAKTYFRTQQFHLQTPEPVLSAHST